MPKLKKTDFTFIKFMKEQCGVQFVDDKGRPIEFEPSDTEEQGKK